MTPVDGSGSDEVSDETIHPAEARTSTEPLPEPGGGGWDGTTSAVF